MKRILLSLAFLTNSAYALTQKEQEKVESLIEEIERGSVRGLDNIWEAIGDPQ